jgi:hypothetical protein
MLLLHVHQPLEHCMVSDYMELAAMKVAMENI